MTQAEASLETAVGLCPAVVPAKAGIQRPCSKAGSRLSPGRRANAFSGRRAKSFAASRRVRTSTNDADLACTEDERTGVHAFVQQLLDDERVELPAATVVDVGVIEGLGWAVVEQNAAWGAGIYGCDPVAVLETIAGASKKRGDAG